jgi:hypothetical protein
MVWQGILAAELIAFFRRGKIQFLFIESSLNREKAGPFFGDGQVPASEVSIQLHDKSRGR